MQARADSQRKDNGPEWTAPGEKPTGDETAEDVLADYRATIARANQVIETWTDLTRPAPRPPGRRALPPSQRWVLVHMIEEVGRHAGHADILREQLDGSTGR